MRICDRCGEQIHGSSGYFSISAFGAKDIEKEYRKSLRGKDFCRECIANIVEFALNKSVCDECVKEMEETAALLNAEDDEEMGSSNQEEPDPDKIDWTEALERIEQSTPRNHYMFLKEEIAKNINAVCEERQDQPGQYIIPLQPIDPVLIQKYRQALKRYGVPKKCVILPVTSSNSQSGEI